MVLLLLTGCALIDRIKGLELEDIRPTLSFDSMELTHLDFDRADVDFNLRVDNPNPVGLNLTSFGWSLLLEGEPFLDGVNDQGLSLEPQGSSIVTLPVSIGFVEVLAVRDLKGQDEVQYRLDGSFGFDSPVGELHVPYGHEGSLPVLRRPKMAYHRLNWKGVDLAKQTASLGLVLKLSHQQGSNLEFMDLSYRIALEGTEVAQGVKEKIGTVEAGQSRRIALPIEVDLVDLGTELARAIKKKEPVRVGLVADVDVNTPWDWTIPLHVEREKEMDFSE